MVPSAGVFDLTRRRLLGGMALAALGLSAQPALARVRPSGRTGLLKVKSAALRGRELPVWWHLPETASPESPVIVLAHGKGRNAESYLESWMVQAEAAGAMLVAPEFTERAFPGALAYNQGWVTDDDGRLRPPELWSFNVVDESFEAVARLHALRRTSYRLYGHSAGAQFVHRLMMLTPAARVEAAVAANAGSYAMPTASEAYPYGLAKVPICEQRLAAALGRPLTILLGDADTDTGHKALPRAPEAMQQGPHRFARGLAFFEAGQREARRLGTPFAWRLSLAPGVAHSNRRMALAAADLLLPATGAPRMMAAGDARSIPLRP